MRLGLIWQALALLTLATALACGGPMGPFPGGRLSGEVGPKRVADWSFVNDHETVQLEVRPEDPYSVNTWSVGIGPSLYVPTSMIFGPLNPTEREWVAAVEKNPAVRIRIDGVVYERSALKVEDDAESTRAREALEANHGIAPEDRDPERTIWIFRLEERAN